MFKKALPIILGLSTCAIAHAAEAPTNIMINNHTSLSLTSKISSFPGQGIAPNASKSVLYYFVTVGCYYSSNKNNCPIEFTDSSNGLKVATVYINSDTATLTQPPMFHGNYANDYEVVGWETSPIKEITITKKA